MKRTLLLLALALIVAVPASAQAPSGKYDSNGNILVGIAAGGSATATVGGLTNTAIVAFNGADPCMSNAKVYLPISQATSTQIVTGTASKKIYPCSLMLVAAAAENVSLVEGTGSVCATGIAAVIGGTTAANGLNLGANGGVAFGSGVAAIAAQATNADNLCLLQAGTVRVAGVLSYVVQ